MPTSVTPRSLLLSVHPRFARAILEGRKTVELRTSVLAIRLCCDS